VIPLYLYARCPFCQDEYFEPIDTYSLAGWSPSLRLEKRFYVPESYPLPKPCSHFIGIHQFVNLHHHPPTEMEYFPNECGEVPYLTPWFFPDDLGAKAILHALPICRLENEQFVPSYTVFSLTYFSLNPKELLRRHHAAEAEWAKDDPDYYGVDLYSPASGKLNLQALAPWVKRNLLGWIAKTIPNLHDLIQWVEHGQLGWLDVTQPNLPIRFGNTTEFPAIYQNIEGIRHASTWHAGKMNIRPF
jgi:hypothetical protein